MEATHRTEYYGGYDGVLYVARGADNYDGGTECIPVRWVLLNVRWTLASTQVDDASDRYQNLTRCVQMISNRC